MKAIRSGQLIRAISTIRGISTTKVMTLCCRKADNGKALTAANDSRLLFARVW
jgi:hypothetical protein